MLLLVASASFLGKPSLDELFEFKLTAMQQIKISMPSFIIFKIFILKHTVKVQRRLTFYYLGGFLHQLYDD